MAEEENLEGTEEGEGGEGGEGTEAAKSGLSGKKIILFIVLPLLFLSGAGLTVFFLMHKGDEATAEAAAAGEEGGVVPEGAQPSTGVFYEMPELLVNLNTSGRRQSFLKIKISLELATPEDTPKLETVMPRVVDNFQVYLRELRAEDLRGSSGLHRLREELLARVKVSAQPAVVKDVLFKEMLIQ